MSKTASFTAEPELVPVGKLNLNKLTFTIPEEADIKDASGKATGKYLKCNLSYLNSKKEAVNGLYLQAPKQFTYGIQPKFTYLKEQTIENLKGYQICYFCSDPNAKEAPKPTSDEQAFIKDLQSLAKKLSEHLKENADFLSPSGAELARDGKLVKSIANFPQKKIIDDKTKREKKVIDKSKPLRFYAELMQNKKTNKILSSFYGPGDIQLDPMTLLEVKGMIEPVIKVEFIYVGDKVVTFQLRVFEANFTPVESASRPRLIGKNTDAPPVSKSSNDDENNDTNTSQHSNDDEEEKKPKSSKPAKSSPKKSANEELDDDQPSGDETVEEEKPKTAKKVVAKPQPSSTKSSSSSSKKSSSSSKTSTKSSKKPAKTADDDDDLDFEE